MSDSQEKKLTVVIPMDVYLRALARMGPKGLKFQGLLLGLLKGWVDSSDEKQDHKPLPKDDPAVDRFREFLKSAAKEDVQTVMSVISRFTETKSKNSFSFMERRRGGR